MSRAFLFALALGFGGLALVAQEKPALTELLQAKARIVQLDAQLAKLAAEHAVCSARLTLAAEKQADDKAKAAKQAIENEAGCVIDWSANPVICKETN